MNFLNLVKRFPLSSSVKMVGNIGSQRLIEYCLKDGNTNLRKDEIFIELCSNGHFSVAQWLYSLGGVNIQAD